MGFGTTLTPPKALGWVHPRLQFSLSAAVAPKLHSEGDKMCVQDESRVVFRGYL